MEICKISFGSISVCSRRLKITSQGLIGGPAFLTEEAKVRHRVIEKERLGLAARQRLRLLWRGPLSWGFWGLSCLLLGHSEGTCVLCLSLPPEPAVSSALLVQQVQLVLWSLAGSYAIPVPRPPGLSFPDPHTHAQTQEGGRLPEPD